MASSSTYCRWKYDVFISFRGADTRDGFVSHLVDALRRNHIITLLDENLNWGEKISSALWQTIEHSCVSVVIFSENYAYSPWCLDELVKIFHCRNVMGQAVLPIFYQIDPNDVQELTGSYGDALLKHREEFKNSLDKVESWCHALKEIAGLSGLVSQNLKPESKLIEKIIGRVLKRLSQPFQKGPCDDGLVGIESQIKDVESLLHFESADVRFLGICGMGGIGKTTLASKVFDQFSSQFEGHCFVANVREKTEKYTLDGLQHEILSKILGKENLNVGAPIMFSSAIRKWTMQKRVLIVLDDVSDLDEIDFVIGGNAMYAPGSRIILTSRDKQILKNRCCEIYEVKELKPRESLQLFSLHAFKQNLPAKAFMEVALTAVKYAQGNPLALQVLGSNLFDKNIVEWKDQLKKLEGSSDKKIQKILRISYDALDDDEKEIFLDIACFFKSQDKDHVKSILETCGHFADIGISRLWDKCLINISGEKLEMHDLLEQMGKDIVRNQCVRNPGKRSRLWSLQEVVHVLTKDLGRISVEKISLDMSRIKDIEVSSIAFKMMKKLKLLRFYSLDYETCMSHYKQDKSYDPCKKLYVSLSKELGYLPRALKYLYWYKYPSKSLPFNFSPENLVQLHLRHSSIQQLCHKNQCLENMKFLDLSYSVDLVKIPDLSELPKLEVLLLRGCIRLVEISLSSQNDTNKLSHLDLGYCVNLCTVPCLLHLENLNYLSLEGCSEITEFPKVPRNIQHLILNGTTIGKVPSSIGKRALLTQLSLIKCTGLKNLPTSIGELKCLTHLKLNGCSELVGLPNGIGELKQLKVLFLDECSKLMHLPEDICNLKSLKYLGLSKCRRLNRLPENLGNLESLLLLFANQSGIKALPSSINGLNKLLDLCCDGCEGMMLPPFTGLPSLKYLSLRNCGMIEIPHTISSLVSLVELDLCGNNLEMLPTGIRELPKLQNLILKSCKRLKRLSDLPSALKSLVVTGCTSLESMPLSVTEGNINSFCWFVAVNCVNLSRNDRIKFMDDLLLRLEIMLPQLKLEVIIKSKLKNPALFSRYNTFEKWRSPYIVDIHRFHTGCHVDGDEVPKRMMYQNNNGSSLVVLLSPDPHDFMVLTFCAVVILKDSPCDYITMLCAYKFVSESAHTLRFSSMEPSGVHYSRKDGEETFGSVQTFLWHSIVRFVYAKHSFSKASFEFYPVFRRNLQRCESSSAVVIKCGVHILYDDTNIDTISVQETMTPNNFARHWINCCTGEALTQIKKDNNA